MNPMLLPFGAMAAIGPKTMAKSGIFGAPIAALTQGKKQQAEDKPYTDTFAGKLGAIGDILLRASGNGGNPHYAAMMQQDLQQRAAQQRGLQEQQQAMQQRQWANEDWMARETWKRDNPSPVNNDTINDFNWYKGLSEADKRTYHQMRPQMVQIDNGDGTKTIVPYNPYGMGGAQQPQGMLPQFSQEDWNNAGGTGSNVGGTFRP